MSIPQLFLWWLPPCRLGASLTNCLPGEADLGGLGLQKFEAGFWLLARD